MCGNSSTGVMAFYQSFSVVLTCVESGSTGASAKVYTWGFCSTEETRELWWRGTFWWWTTFSSPGNIFVHLCLQASITSRGDSSQRRNGTECCSKLVGWHRGWVGLSWNGMLRLLSRPEMFRAYCPFRPLCSHLTSAFFFQVLLSQFHLLENKRT